MKQNILIIPLAVVATLLLVNLVQDRFPPTAHAAIGAHEWTVACPSSGKGDRVCYAINMAGDVYIIRAGPKPTERIGTLQ